MKLKTKIVPELSREYKKKTTNTSHRRAGTKFLAKSDDEKRVRAEHDMNSWTASLLYSPSNYRYSFVRSFATGKDWSFRSAGKISCSLLYLSLALSDFSSRKHWDTWQHFRHTFSIHFACTRPTRRLAEQIFSAPFFLYF